LCRLICSLIYGRNAVKKRFRMFQRWQNISYYLKVNTRPLSLTIKINISSLKTIFSYNLFTNSGASISVIVEEWPKPPHQKGTKSGTMICISMAANYLAVYYLKGHHKNTHPRQLLHSMHTYMPAEGRWEAPSYRPAIGRCSGAALVPP
jgi:hypothetical protein